MNKHLVSSGPYMCSVNSQWEIYQNGQGIPPNSIPGNPIELVFDKPGQIAELHYFNESWGPSTQNGAWNPDNEWSPTINIPNHEFKMTYWDNDIGHQGPLYGGPNLIVKLHWEPILPTTKSVNLPCQMQMLAGAGNPIASPQLLIVLTNNF